MPSYRENTNELPPIALSLRVVVRSNRARLWESFRTIKLGEMRDKCKGKAAYLESLRGVVRTAKDKAVDEGSTCPFFSKLRVAVHSPKTPVESLYSLRITWWYVVFKYFFTWYKKTLYVR